jgi:RimJ/RimL family protein N-acetyltransferase
LLRDFLESDLEAVYDLWSDPEVTRWTDYSTDTLLEAQQWLDNVIHCNRQNPRVVFNLAIVLGEGGPLIGWIGIGPASHGTAAGEMSAGFSLRRDWWGRGYMTEVLRILLGFAFDTLRAPRVSAQCYPKNVASARVMEKAGMRFDYQGLMPGGDGEVREYRRYVARLAGWRS